MADVSVGTLGGRNILYDRHREGDYGVTGVPIKPFMNPAFAKECEACFTQLVSEVEAAKLGPVGSILTGGISRAGTGTSLHHKNRAFDLDGLVIPSGNWVANTFPQRPHIYLGIEAVLRQHFGTVLSFDYNQAHEDHFHFDNGTSVGFETMSKSRVIYLQNVIVFIYHTKIGRDGVWGPETRGASDKIRKRLGIGGFSNKKNWMQFLRQAAGDAFALEAAMLDGGT